MCRRRGLALGSRRWASFPLWEMRVLTWPEPFPTRSVLFHEINSFSHPSWVAHPCSCCVFLDLFQDTSGLLSYNREPMGKIHDPQALTLSPALPFSCALAYAIIIYIKTTDFMLKIPTCWSFQNMSPLTIHAFHKSPKAKVCMWWEGKEGYCKPKTGHLVCIFLLFTAWDVCSCTWYTF